MSAILKHHCCHNNDVMFIKVGIFDRLTLISDDILKKPEPIFEYFELKTGHQFIARRLAYCFYKKYGDFWTRRFDSQRGQAYFQACPVWIYTLRVISQATYKPFYNYIDINLHSYVKSLHYVLFKT